MKSAGRWPALQDMKAASYLYALSLPERTVGSISALGGGLLREASQLALPVKIREAALYQATAGVALRFPIEQVGDVRGIYPPDDPLAREFVYRCATGTSVELLSINALYLSPVWVLAALGEATAPARVSLPRSATRSRRKGCSRRTCNSKAWRS